MFALLFLLFIFVCFLDISVLRFLAQFLTHISQGWVFQFLYFWFVTFSFRLSLGFCCVFPLSHHSPLILTGPLIWYLLCYSTIPWFLHQRWFLRNLSNDFSIHYFYFLQCTLPLLSQAQSYDHVYINFFKFTSLPLLVLCVCIVLSLSSFCLIFPYNKKNF